MRVRIEQMAPALGDPQANLARIAAEGLAGPLAPGTAALIRRHANRTMKKFTTTHTGNPIAVTIASASGTERSNARAGMIASSSAEPASRAVFLTASRYESVATIRRTWSSIETRIPVSTGRVSSREAAFATRSQVRVGDELYAVPNDALELAHSLAS